MFGKIITLFGEFILCTLFAPGGVLKIALRQKQNKQKLVQSGEKMLVIAGVLSLLFYILITDSTMITNPFTYIYGAGAVLAIFFGISMVVRGKKNNKYKAAIENHNIYKANEIAKYMGKAEETVINDILRMISEGLFPDFKFDMQTKTVMLNDDAMRRIPSKAIECDSCGASVTVFEGMQNKCEYCGEALNYN